MNIVLGILAVAALVYVEERISKTQPVLGTILTAFCAFIILTVLTIM